MIAGDDHQRREDERLHALVMLEARDHVLDHRSRLDRAEGEASGGLLIERELELAVHRVCRVVRRAVAHEDDHGVLLREILRETLDEDVGHQVAVGG
ncbi:hypothetical protein SDC9_203719 [bioreactor metagenome]|uniref:Uncharacterized protein n=1 Tax=bioreactor metagenome TaxID=1076179 RepID=A0A645J6D6_9ZZZZ